MHQGAVAGYLTRLGVMNHSCHNKEIIVSSFLAILFVTFVTLSAHAQDGLVTRPSKSSVSETAACQTLGIVCDARIHPPAGGS